MGYSRGKLLTSPMKSGTPEDSRRFASECLCYPQFTSGVEEGLALGGHHSKTRRKPEQKTISLRELLWPDLWHIHHFWRGLHLLQYHIGECFRYLLYSQQIKTMLKFEIPKTTIPDRDDKSLLHLIITCQSVASTPSTELAPRWISRAIVPTWPYKE